MLPDTLARVTPPSTSASSKTPNCVRCSRSQEHTTCEVVRLIADDWIVIHIIRDRDLNAVTRASSSQAGNPGLN